MLPRRFALIRHVDYTGVAGTGVIAYGVAFDDGQVVLRWSSAHRATSVLDSVEDLVAAHGHGETTSIEWIDAPPGQVDDTLPQHGGRRARRPAAPDDARAATDNAPATTEPCDVRQATPEEPTATTSPPRVSEQAQPGQEETGAVPPAQPAATTPPTTAPEPDADAHGPPQLADPGQQATPTGTASPVQPSAGTPAAPTRKTPSAEPASPGMPHPPATAPPSPNGVATQSPAPEADERAASAPADVIDHRAAARATDERPQPRPEAVTTQPMKGLPPHRPRRAERTPDSPRSIIDEVEEPHRLELPLASTDSNSRGWGSDDTEDDPRGAEQFNGFFASEHQHLDTVTGLLDLPASLTKGNRRFDGEDESAMARRNGRHRRGE